MIASSLVSHHHHNWHGGNDVQRRSRRQWSSRLHRSALEPLRREWGSVCRAWCPAGLQALWSAIIITIGTVAYSGVILRGSIFVACCFCCAWSLVTIVSSVTN